jgi:glutaredoxin
MEIVAYTLSGCNHCTSLKELFRRAQTDYTEVMVKRDMLLEDFQKEYPGITHFPYVVIDKEPIGGLVDVVKRFVAKGLVTSSRRE